MSLSELNTEDENFVWAVVKNENGNLEIYSKGYDAYLYTKSMKLRADKMSDAGSYTIEVDNEKKALVIKEGSKYLSNGGTISSTTIGYWKFELIGTEEGGLTSIVEVETEVAAPAMEGIYELTGRKIEEITKPGIYIINGQKRLVK